MWEWFIAKGWWIAVAVALGILLLVVLWRWSGQIIRRTTPERSSEQSKGITKLTRRIIMVIASILVILTVAAVVILSLDINITPA